MRRGGAVVLLAGFLVALAGVTATSCKSVERFSSGGGHYEGVVTAGSFVRSNFAEDVKLCVVLDAHHLQDTPGVISSSDGRFRATPMRPIPQIWHDPLSTLSFGDGRTQNMMYMATPDDGVDVTVVMSLMNDGNVEVRLLRGAPGTGAGGGGADAGTAAPTLFGVFPLERREGACPF